MPESANFVNAEDPCPVGCSRDSTWGQAHFDKSDTQAHTGMLAAIVVVRVLDLSVWNSGRVGRSESVHERASAVIKRSHRGIVPPKPQGNLLGMPGRGELPSTALAVCLDPWSQFFPVGENWRNCGRLSVRDIWPRHSHTPYPLQGSPHESPGSCTSRFFRSRRPGENVSTLR